VGRRAESRASYGVANTHFSAFALDSHSPTGGILKRAWAFVENTLKKSPTNKRFITEIANGPPRIISLCYF